MAVRLVGDVLQVSKKDTTSSDASPLTVCENGAEIDDLISRDVVVSQMMGLKDGGLLTKF